MYDAHTFRMSLRYCPGLCRGYAASPLNAYDVRRHPPAKPGAFHGRASGPYLPRVAHNPHSAFYIIHFAFI